MPILSTLKLTDAVSPPEGASVMLQMYEPGANPRPRVDTETPVKNPWSKSGAGAVIVGFVIYPNPAS